MRLLRGRFEPDEPSNAATGVWMVSFSDLLTVLLAMFVMRFSMSTFNPDALEKVFPDTQVIEAPEKSAAEVLVESLAPVVEGSSREPLPLGELEARHDITVEARGNGALIRLGGETFEPASRILSIAARDTLFRVGEFLRASDYLISVAGHTDDIPISTTVYPSNWELSAARAIEVAEIFLRVGIPGERISAVGYAETKPVADNATPEGRQQNRRVEIFVAPPAQSDGAPSEAPPVASGITPRQSAAANSLGENG
jgi:chemotaxis protein MotB